MQLTHQIAVPGRLGGRELAFDAAQGGVTIYCVFDGGTLERRRLLRDVRDAPVRRQLDLALVGVQLAAQQREQARLARAVGADQPDAFAGIEE